MFYVAYDNFGGSGGSEGLLERSWVGSSIDGSEGVSKVPIHGAKSSTLKVQLMSKFGRRIIT